MTVSNLKQNPISDSFLLRRPGAPPRAIGLQQVPTNHRVEPDPGPIFEIRNYLDLASEPWRRQRSVARTGSEGTRNKYN
jgi:hypothetical protein